MSDGGFYLMHRGWQDNPVFRNEEFSRRDAFVWLIEEAAYRPTRVHASTGAIALTRGQLSHSLRFMAKAWKWDEAKVRRFLAALAKENIIDVATDAGQTVITVCNYDKYQTIGGQADAATDAGATQQRRGGDAKKNEGKEGKEGKKEERESAPAVADARSLASKPDPFPRPDWADATVWADFLKNRKTKRLPNTATAHVKFLADVQRNSDPDWPPGRLLEEATGRGHGAIYPSIKEGTGGHGNAANRFSGPAPRSRNGFLNAFNEAEANRRRAANG